jgi:hypothetical protein
MCARLRPLRDADHTRRELLDGLEKRGFRLTDGPEGTGTVGLASTRGGGFHVDTGACARIIDGSVKVRSDARLARFDERRLVFDDGSVLPADVVIWAVRTHKSRLLRVLTYLSRRVLRMHVRVFGRCSRRRMRRRCGRYNKWTLKEKPGRSGRTRASRGCMWAMVRLDLVFSSDMYAERHAGGLSIARYWSKHLALRM